MAFLSPLLLSQWHPTKNSLVREEVKPFSNKKAWWKCSAGHEWEATIANRTKGNGCGICSGHIKASGSNDLVTTNPKLAAQWHPHLNNKTPYEMVEGSHYSAWWQCEQGHEWKASVKSRARQLRNCPFCAGQRCVSGENDILTCNPQLAEQWHTAKNVLTPSQVALGHNGKVWWQCNLEHEWQASPNSRRKKVGCPICANRTVVEGYNDLFTTHPLIAQQWHPTLNSDLLPTKVTAGSAARVWWQCSEGHSWQVSIVDRGRVRGCPSCAHNGPSSGELEIGEWLVGLGQNLLQNDRLCIKPHELDLYLPDHNFAIEYNGLYWHSEAAGKAKDYHKNKVEAAQTAGVSLFQVWEDDWQNKQAIIKRMILHKLGLSDEPVIFARKTTVVTLNTSQAHAFLEETHIQGKANGGLYLGLVANNTQTLVAVMVLKQMSDEVVYLERYATSCRVPGGFSKLLNTAIVKLQPQKMITFADYSVSDGNLYEKNGFIAESILAPDYSYLVKGKRVHKFNYRLKRFREDPSLRYQDGLSEQELARLNNLHRIWDSGKIRYVKEF